MLWERRGRGADPSSITTWLRNKIDPRTVMEYAGHADLATTLRFFGQRRPKDASLQ
jgi:integrase